MKRYCMSLTHAALFAGSSLLFAQEPPAGTPSEERGERPQRGQRGQRMAPPIIAAIDANKDGTLSSDEIAGAATALRTLDQDGDGQLSAEEMHPMPPSDAKGGAGGRKGPRGERGPRPDAEGGKQGPRPDGPRRMKPPFIGALDADDSQSLSEAEIANAPEALKTLDKNKDDTLTPEELMPRPERGQRGPRGEGGGRRGPGGPGGPPRGE